MATQAELLKPPQSVKSDAITVTSPTPMEMLQTAVSQGANLEMLSKLLDLQERWEKNEARKAFVTAMTEFKKNPPQINKNKHVKFGNTEYDHATLDNVVDTIGTALSQHGLSHAWKVEQGPDRVRVTCVITHEQGHSETVSLESPPDNSGSKNSIQAIASAVTYLQRYSLLSATGLAAKGQDNDAGGLTNGELCEKLEFLENCRSVDELKKQFTVAFKEFSAKGNHKALAVLSQKKDALLKEFHDGKR